jgi:hypothetical protein
MTKQTKMTPALAGTVGATLVALLLVGTASAVLASEAEHADERNDVTAPPSPASQTDESVQSKSAGCMTCH